MRKYTMGVVLGVLSVGVAMCGGQAPMVASTPRPAPTAEIVPLAPPSAKLAVPVPDAEWVPQHYATDKGRGLVSALNEAETLALILPKKGNPAELENRVFRMLKAAAPDTRVVARGNALLDHLMEERGEIPYRVTMEPGGTDAYGQPYYIPKEHPLNTDWLSKRKTMKGAEVMLVIRPIRISDIRLRELRNEKRGDCSGIQRTLQEGVDAAESYFSFYKGKASEVLGAEFGRHLAAALPFWRSELVKIAELTENGSTQEKCLEAYTRLLDRYAPCVDKGCPVGPALYSQAGGVIGMPDPKLNIPPSCPSPGMRDFAAEISDLADRSVSEVLPALDTGWAGELARAGGLQRVRDVVADSCAPRHRRFLGEDIEQARRAVREHLESLAAQDIVAVWESMGGMEHIAGHGPVRVFARVKVSTGDSSTQAAALEGRLRDMDRCGEGDERTLQATLVKVGTGEVVFMGLFFEEQLLCEDFPPE